MSVVYKPKVGARSALGFLPVVGDVLDAALPPVDQRPQAVGVPTTVGASLVPEVALLPGFVCAQGEGKISAALGLSDKVSLNDLGVPGISARPTTGRPIDHDFLARLMATPFADVLRGYSDRAYLRVKVEYGQLSIRLDGFIDDDELDALAEAVSAAAAGVVESAVPMLAPRPFSDAFADPQWPQNPADVLDREAPTPPTRWLPWLHAYAQDHGATAEDPIAYHRAFPHLPVPGTAFVVMRLPLPGTSIVGRVAWHNEMNILTHNVGCNAVLLPAASDAQSGDIVRVRDLKLQYAVRDGIFSVWAMRLWQSQEEGMGDMDGLVEHAIRIGRETGLAQI